MMNKLSWECKSCGHEGVPKEPYFNVCPKCLMNKMVVKDEKQKKEVLESLYLLSSVSKGIFVEIVEESGAVEKVHINCVNQRFEQKLEERIEVMRRTK